MDSSPGLQPGVSATKEEKPQTGRRSIHSMRYRPIETISSSHRPTANTFDAFLLYVLARPSRTKLGVVPYGKKVRATGN